MGFWGRKEKDAPGPDQPLPDFVHHKDPPTSGRVEVRPVEEEVDEPEEEEEEETEEEEEGLPFPKSVLPVVSISEKELSQYEALADEVGFSPAELTRLRLLFFFADKGIPLFGNKEVKEWLLERRSGADNDIPWNWRALRASDVSDLYDWGVEDGVGEDGFYTSTDAEQAEFCEPYDRLVPLQVLQLVKEIEDAIGRDKINFYVSDYDDEKASTFIMVRPSADDPGYGEFNLIFGNWDNPIDRN
jgi:hypothetical protein